LIKTIFYYPQIRQAAKEENTSTHLEQENSNSKIATKMGKHAEFFKGLKKKKKKLKWN